MLVMEPSSMAPLHMAPLTDTTGLHMDTMDLHTDTMDPEVVGITVADGQNPPPFLLLSPSLLLWPVTLQCQWPPQW